MKTNKVRSFVLPLIAAMIWGTAFTMQDICADSIDPFTFNATRSIVAVVVLLIIIFIFDKLKKDKPVLTPEEKKAARKDLILGGFCCGTALTLASSFQQAGIAAGTDGGKAGFINALYVVLVPLFGLFLKRKVELPVWIAVGLSVASLYLLCMNGDKFRFQIGDLLVLVCAFCFVFHIYFIDHFTATVDGIKLSCVQFMVVGLWSVVAKIICIILGLNGIGNVASASSIFAIPNWSAIIDCIIPILYLGIFSSGVAYTLQILAQKNSNTTVVTIILSMESLFAVISGAIILHQQMSGREYLGCALMLAAVILAQIPNPFKKKAKT